MPLGENHVAATYELATRIGAVAELAAEAGVDAARIDDWTGEGLDARERAWLRAMFDYYDQHGLPVATLPLRTLLGQAASSEPAVRLSSAPDGAAP